MSAQALRKRAESLPRYLALIAGGVVLDLLGTVFVSATGAPLFLDTIGTIAASALGGVIPGIIVGLTTNVVIGIQEPSTLYYASVNMLVAVLTASFAWDGAFSKALRTLKAALITAAVCGLLGSTLSWALAGMNIGAGAPEALCRAIADATGWNAYFCQLIGDTALEALDKLIVFALVFLLLFKMPQRIAGAFRYGPLNHWRCSGDESVSELPDFHRNLSLSTKTGIITTLAIGALSILFIIGAYSIYTNTADARYQAFGRTTNALAATRIDADAIDAYLAQGADAPGYATTLASLQHLDAIMDDVNYIYVYKVEEDGCHVVFDTDSDPATVGKLGDVIPVEEAFSADMPALLAGDEIAPIVTLDRYGWLMSVYTPLQDSTGTCVAYIGSDIAMGDIIADRVAFIAKLASMLLAASIFIIVLASVVMRRSIVRPINRLSKATADFAFDSDETRAHDAEALRAVDIQSGDEVENLYGAIIKMTDEAVSSIDEIATANDKIAHQVDVIRRMQENTILSFANLTDARDKLTGGHIRRTARYVGLLSHACLDQHVYPDQITPTFVDDAIRSAPLHDIGKIEISDTLLNKPTALTDEEYEIMKTHAPLGGKILKSVLAGISEEDSGYLDMAVDMATYHHERWDGKGYPQGLVGEQIPLCARIMAVADVFDALVSKRSYKTGFSFDECMAIMRSESGKAFDPILLEVFLGLEDEVRKAALAANTTD